MKDVQNLAAGKEEEEIQNQTRNPQQIQVRMTLKNDHLMHRQHVSHIF
jgi:hypothetical protein